MNPNVSSVKLDDEESSLKWCDLWLGNRKEGIFSVLWMGEVPEDRIIGDESILEIEIYLKKDLKNFEVDSNLEDVRWISCILNSED